jgi:hypothetical protein
VKDLNEMSWPELTKLREQLNNDLGEDAAEGDFGELNDSDLLEAFTGLAELKEAAPAVKKGAPKSPPKGYPTSKGKYADPTNFKYPLDTEAHVRAALAYFSKAKNRAPYSPQEQKFMWKRIIAATKKYDIELSDDVKKHAEKIGESNSSDGEEVNEELNEKEIIELIDKHIKEQMGQTGQAPGTMEKAGYPPPKVRVPPDVEAINQQLENFKSLHAQHSLNNDQMSAKVSALTKQVSDLNAGFKKMSASFGSDSSSSSDSSDDGTSDTSSSSENEAVSSDDSSDSSSDTGDGQNSNGGGQQEMAEKQKEEAAAAAKETGETKTAGEAPGTKEAKAASSTAEESPDSTPDDSAELDESQKAAKAKEKQDSKKIKNKHSHKKKVKEAMKQAKAHGLTATDDQAKGTGTQPPGFGVAEDADREHQGFADTMNKATKLRRRGIGAT